ncbi:MAG: structural protein [Nitrospirota bacterium]
MSFMQEAIKEKLLYEMGQSRYDAKDGSGWTAFPAWPEPPEAGRPARSNPSVAQLRQAAPQGPFSTWFDGYVPRVVSPEFYEVMREAIPLLGGAIRRLSSLTGTLQVEGNNAKIVDELREFFTFVPVNDFQVGIQSFLDNWQNEVFEQGFAIAEKVWTKNRRDIRQLRIGDSKFIFFKNDAKGNIYATMRPKPWPRLGLYDPTRSMHELLDPHLLSGAWSSLGYYPVWAPMEVPLDLTNKMYLSFHGNNQDPYGESLLHGMEFVTQFLATIINQGRNIFERFGDPSYNVQLKTSGKDLSGSDNSGVPNAQKRLQELKNDFDAVMRRKRKGLSGDFINVIDKDSNLAITVIGADGKILVYEVPYQICVEQILSKTGLLPWMLGISSGRQASAQDDPESALVMQDADLRKAVILPHLQIMARELLRARGRTWKEGDFVLSLVSPNLHNIQQAAQARFLNAQANLMESGARLNNQNSSDEDDTDAEDTPTDAHEPDGKIISRVLFKSAAGRAAKAEAGRPACKEAKTKDPQAEAIVQQGLSATLSLWSELQKRVFKILALPTPDISESFDAPGLKAVDFTPAQLAQVKDAIMQFAEDMVANSRTLQGPVVTYTGRAHALGFLQAANASGQDIPLLDLLKNEAVYKKLLNDGFDLVRNDATRFYQDEIKPAMQAGVLRGANSRDIASELADQFGSWNSDWERLVRSEVCLAQERGKKSEWKAEKIKRVHFSPAPGACEICASLEGDYDIDDCPTPVDDTHPRCTCSINLAKSELS